MPITIRFVACSGAASEAIIAREQICMPFTPSHVECVTPEGKYAGQHINGGMLAREPGYDKAELLHELFVAIDVSQAQADAFYSYVAASIGEPYDWKAIVDFALPLDLHQANHSICSAKMTLALRKGQVWPWPLTVPAHLISPRDVLLMLSGIVKIDH